MKVYKVNNDQDDKMVVLSKNNFETTNECKSFADYGQKIGCDNAGCYSLNNSESDCRIDMALSIQKSLLFLKDYDFKTNLIVDFLDWVEFIEGIESNFDVIFTQDQKDEIQNKVRFWLQEKENHTKHEAYDYWDGSNHKTLVLRNESDITDLSEIEDNEEEKILKAFEKYDTYIYNGVCQSKKINGYEFSNSRMSDDYAIAWVKKA